MIECQHYPFVDINERGLKLLIESFLDVQCFDLTEFSFQIYVDLLII